MIISEEKSYRAFQALQDTRTHNVAGVSSLRGAAFWAWGASQRLMNATAPVMRDARAYSGRPLQARYSHWYFTPEDRSCACAGCQHRDAAREA